MEMSATSNSIPMSDTADHYTRIGANYDRYFDFHFQTCANFIMNQCGIEIKPTDRVLDIGGGSGGISQLIYHQANLKHPVLCVDPSKEMLDTAKDKKGVVTLCATAEEFFSDVENNKQSYNLVMACGCYHYWTDPASVFARLGEYLTDDGICVISKYNSKTDNMLPLPMIRTSKVDYGFKSSMEKFEGIKEHAERNGFVVRKVSGMEYYKVEKSLWYEAHRSRFMSSLHLLSDEQIKQGIEELETEFGNLETIQLEIPFIAIVLSKK